MGSQACGLLGEDKYLHGRLAVLRAISYLACLPFKKMLCQAMSKPAQPALVCMGTLKWSYSQNGDECMGFFF